jgi:predicted nicotinamide N-methyase
VAAQELQNHVLAVQGKSVFIWGAGVGVEAQAVAELGAKSILATDIHPTTLQQLELGIMENDRILNKELVQTQIFDLMAETPFPNLSADLVVVADVLYNEQLANHVVRRVVEYWKHNPEVKVLITDSQRFVDIMKGLQDGFSKAIVNDNKAREEGMPLIRCTEETLVAFTGSGVCIDEDQTYDVKVRKIWIGFSD